MRVMAHNMKNPTQGKKKEREDALIEVLMTTWKLHSLVNSYINLSPMIWVRISYDRISGVFEPINRLMNLPNFLTIIFSKETTTSLFI